MTRDDGVQAQARWFRRGFVVLPVALLVAVLLGAGTLVALDSRDSPVPLTKPIGLAAPDRSSPASDSTASSHRPNIVMVLVDDMRWDEIAWMPNVRHYLGAQGNHFRNSFAPYPLCCPGRASLLSGQYAHNHGVLSHNPPYGFRAFNDEHTLATALQNAGYRTSFIGKYLNGYGTQKTYLGEADSATYIPPGWDSWLGAVESNMRDRSDPLFGGVYFYFDTTMNIQGDLTPMDGRYSTELFGELARDEVQRVADSSTPWFLYLSMLAPHHGAPQEPDDPEPRWLKGGDDPIWGGYFTPARPDWIKGSLDDRITKGMGVPLPGQPAERTATKPAYLSTLPPLDDVDRQAIRTITRQRAEALVIADNEFGRLMETLDRTDQLDETLVVFSSDNGYYLGEQRQREGKIKPHEPSIRVPLLLRAPGIAPGVRDDPVSTLDITATLLDYAGADPPQELDGQSVRQALEQGDSGWDTPVMTESIISRVPPDPNNAGWSDFSSIGLRLPEWSYTRYATGEVELYNMRTDPEQLRNLNGAQRVAEMEAALANLLTQRTDCSGAQCYRPLDPQFRLGSARNTALTSRSIAAHEERFGELRKLTRAEAAAIFSRRRAD